jgi:hypothetical protein
MMMMMEENLVYVNHWFVVFFLVYDDDVSFVSDAQASEAQSMADAQRRASPADHLYRAWWPSFNDVSLILFFL